MNQLKERIEASGFAAEVSFGKLQQGGYHLQLSVQDKRQQLYALGEEVGFRADPAGPPVRFRVRTCTWDATAKEFIYHIESTADRNHGFKTVPESSLSRIRALQ